MSTLDELLKEKEEIDNKIQEYLHGNDDINLEFSEKQESDVNIKTPTEDKTDNNFTVSNNIFNGLVWDGKAIEAVNLVANALLNLTELFKSQNIQIESLLKINTVDLLDKK
jgi:hypothetical protein